jgi:hypothetical protein
MANMPIKSQASYVEYGFGQVEPNHLSAQRTSQVYAQLPANPAINVLEQGQFVKYDYAANDNGIGEVNFTGAGEWMLVYNEIKLYREHQRDCEFALIKDNYHARVYSPYDYEKTEDGTHEQIYNPWNLNNKDMDAYHGIAVQDGVISFGEGAKAMSYPVDDVTADVRDIYEMGWTNDPGRKMREYKEKMMAPGTAMFPRVFKTNVGDIFTTNTVNATELKVGDILTPGAQKTNEDGSITGGILEVAGEDATMKWQVVKVYTMPDGQKGVKVMRIA